MLPEPPGPESRGLSREELLWWLNDRVGEQLSVCVVVDGGSAFVLSGHGKLSHWSQAAPDWASAGERRDDIAGLYKIGDWSIDVTELDERCAAALTPLGDGAVRVEVLLAEEVSIEITRPPL
jgi:hypothetical protein